MEGINHINFVTTQYAKLAIGKSEKTIPFIACSTARFTEVGELASIAFILLMSAG